MLPAYNEVKQAASSSLEQLETLRRQLMTVRWRQRWILFGILIFNGAVYLLAPTFLFFSIVVFIVMTILYWRRKKKGAAQFRSEFKNSVVAPLTQKMVELCSLPNETESYEYNCDYRPTERIEDDLIYRSKLYNFNITAIHGEDLFTGRLGVTDFKFSEIKLIEEQSSTDSDGTSSTAKVTMFNGILFVADFHKEFAGLTVLSGNMSAKNSRAGKLITRLERKLMNKKSDIAKTVILLENEAFNDAFHVRTSDEVEARYLLSSSMMERLLHFKSRGKGRMAQINISFVDSCMFVSIWSHKDHFEANIKKEVSDKLLEELYQDLSFYFGLIEDFDLNTRIWSKE
jgi:hypothetical protein